MRKKVLVTREVFDETLEYLSQPLRRHPSNQAHAKLAPDELARKLQGIDAAVISTSDRIDDALLARCPTLKAVCSASVGYNHIDLAACTGLWRDGNQQPGRPGRQRGRFRASV